MNTFMLQGSLYSSPHVNVEENPILQRASLMFTESQCTVDIYITFEYYLCHRRIPPKHKWLRPQDMLVDDLGVSGASSRARCAACSTVWSLPCCHMVINKGLFFVFFIKTCSTFRTMRLGTSWLISNMIFCSHHLINTQF